MKRTLSIQAIYVLWLREMKGMWRAKSRVVGSLGMPIFFLAFLGLGLEHASIPGLPAGVDYVEFLTPGIIGMTLLFSSMFAGISVLWDKEFGFLKEVMVAPVSRLSIVLGRTAGGSTVSIMQGLLILALSTLLGFKISGVIPFMLAIVFMCLISFTFIGSGLIFASRMRDMQGFTLIVNFVMFPTFLLSGALFPIQELPSWLVPVCYANPLTYGVDGLRGVLLGAEASGVPILFDFVLITALSIGMVGIGSYLFESTEVER
ncbi:MAG TPA: multidrug ABC transporter permease [Methanophagales archaeon]|nr:multidrug ABC transporter permease [Methanophagales archaeon]